MSNEPTLQDLAQSCRNDSDRWWPGNPRHNELEFFALCASGEFGEAANSVKKVWRGSETLEEARDKILEEYTDGFVYMLNIFAILGADPYEWYQRVWEKNEARWGAKHYVA